MGMKSSPRLREEKEEKKEARLEKEATAEEREEKVLVKKWKGKDWFNILAPRELGARLLGQTPTTDPKSLIGRIMEVGIPEITGDNSKYYMKLRVRINKIEGKTCLTSFGGFECAREHLLRMVRKRNQKVENVFDVVTKDGWLLRIKPWMILNGKPAASVSNKMRSFTMNFFNEFAKKNNMNDLVRKVISTEIQMRVKKEGSKIYPVRFSEVARIKVLRSPEFKITKPKPEEKPGEEKKEAKPEEKPRKEKEKPKETKSKKK
jgi:small subunit ribosomal protein S3Ae